MDVMFQNWGISHGVYPWILFSLVGEYLVMLCIQANCVQAKIIE